MPKDGGVIDGVVNSCGVGVMLGGGGPGGGLMLGGVGGYGCPIPGGGEATWNHDTTVKFAGQEAEPSTFEEVRYLIIAFTN